MKRKRDNRQRPSPTAAAAPAEVGVWRWWAAGAILAAVVVGVYLPTLRAGLLDWDDGQYVGANYHVRTLSWATVEWAFTSTLYAGNWHPLTWLSHALDVQLYGQTPDGRELTNLWGHHLTNVLLHAANAVLVLLVLRGLTGRFWVSLAAAGFFALHPLRVECVAWVAERKELLCTMFTLLTILAYLRYAARATAGRYALVFLALAAALASKPMAVTVPLVLLLLDFWPLKRLSWRTVAEKLPLVALSVGSCVLAMAAHAGYYANEEIGLGARVGNAVVSYVAYLGKLFWPAPGTLLPLYVHPADLPGGLAAWKIAVAAMILVALSAVAASQWRRRPWLLVGWLWYLGATVPVCGLVQVGAQGMADRYTYATMIGVVLAVVLLAAEVVERRGGLRFLAAGAAALAVVALGWLAWAQEPVWATPLTLWQYTVDHEPESVVARSFLWNAEGMELTDRGDIAGAIKKFRGVLALDKGNLLAMSNLGVCLGMTGQLPEAATLLRQAMQQDPNDPKARCNLGLTLLGLPGGLDEAVEQFQASLKLDPGHIQALAGLARAEMGRGRPAAAVAYWRQVAAKNPLTAGMHLEFGVALHRAGRAAEAAAELRQALALEPRLAPAKAELEEILAEQRRGKPAQGN